MSERNRVVAFRQMLLTLGLSVVWLLAPSLAAAEDFCGDMLDSATMFESVCSQTLEGEQEIERVAACALLSLLDCTSSDLNGPRQNGGPGPNGMPDFPFEIAVVSTLLGRPDLDLSSGTAEGQVARGVKASDVVAAVNGNHEVLRGAVCIESGSLLPLPPLAEGSPPDLMARALGAYMVIGDPGSVNTVKLYVKFIGFCPESQVDAVMSHFVRLPEILGPEGDADGDGFTNRQEYVAFSHQGSEAYVSAALDPMTKPEVPPPTIVGPGLVAEGQPLELVVRVSGLEGNLSYSWTKDNRPLPEETADSLFVLHAAATDAGSYQVMVSDSASKSATVSTPFYVVVGPPGSVPVVGPVGTAVVLIMISLLYRRAHR